MWKQEVEVLSITQATDVLSGNPLYQVSFGLIGEPVQGFAPPQMKKIASNILVMYLSRDKECPYVAGSKWLLIIEDDGTTALKKKEM